MTSDPKAAIATSLQKYASKASSLLLKSLKWHLGAIALLLVVFFAVAHWVPLGDERAVWIWFAPAFFAYLAVFLIIARNHHSKPMQGSSKK